VSSSAKRDLLPLEVEDREQDALRGEARARYARDRFVRKLDALATKPDDRVACACRVDGGRGFYDKLVAVAVARTHRVVYRVTFEHPKRDGAELCEWQWASDSSNPDDEIDE
jgi:hypothetical protein